MVARFSSFYLVSLHGFQHAEAADVDYADLVSLASSGVEIHERHDVLRELGVLRVGCDVDDLKRKEQKIQRLRFFHFFCNQIQSYLIDETAARRVDVQTNVDEVSLHTGSGRRFLAIFLDFLDHVAADESCATAKDRKCSN